ncbi:MAG: hypothetical protein WCL37_06420, partial [Chrysiogenales bacterium]
KTVRFDSVEYFFMPQFAIFEKIEIIGTAVSDMKGNCRAAYQEKLGLKIIDQSQKLKLIWVENFLMHGV